MAKDGTNIETKKTQSKRSAKSQRVLRILLIILLWVVLLPAIGLAALFCVGVLSEIILNNNEGAGSVSSQFVLSGVLGIILLMLLIGVLKYLSRPCLGLRTNPPARHTRQNRSTGKNT